VVESKGLIIWDLVNRFREELKRCRHSVVAVEVASRRRGGGNAEGADAQEEEGRDVFVQDFLDVKGAVACGGEGVQGECLEESGKVCTGEEVVFVVGEDVVEEAEGLENGGTDGIAVVAEVEEGVDGYEAGFVAGVNGFFVEFGGASAGEIVEAEGVGDDGV